MPGEDPVALELAFLPGRSRDDSLPSLERRDDGADFRAASDSSGALWGSGSANMLLIWWAFSRRAYLRFFLVWSLHVV